MTRKITTLTTQHLKRVILVPASSKRAKRVSINSYLLDNKSFTAVSRFLQFRKKLICCLPSHLRTLLDVPDFEILYEEGPCLAINKPAGLLTQAPRWVDSLERRIKKYLCENEGRPENGYLGIPHRLDRPVSGVILFGKHSRAAHRLAKQFEKREVKKRYWAVVAGTVEPSTGTWIDFMRKIPDVPQGEIVPEDHPDARKGILHYTVLQTVTFPNTSASPIQATLLEIELETGRSNRCGIPR